MEYLEGVKTVIWSTFSFTVTVIYVQNGVFLSMPIKQNTEK